ncbi:MAG: polyprenyl diphosphate synthase [Oscillospiraceae bacterium]|nr:polyprenyl diphosphate synthase [Oscillospiraceae bacterium]
MGISAEKLPRHVGFIMDGNGRWAQKRGLPRKMGHRAGAEVFKKIADYCREIGIQYVTFYAFSTENWKRPADEVNALMDLFDKYLDDAEEYARKKTRMLFLGDKAPFRESIRQKMLSIEERTREFDSCTVMLAMNYGGRDDIVYAAKRAAELVSSGYMSADDITEDMFGGLLYTGDAPDVDLVIRPSGEYRLSNFLIWQCAYAEYYFSDVLWPDFTVSDLDRALTAYSDRNRRFGGV